ncbi:MAG: endonuclease/exonuclease/phosphatase family protein [Myxococcales bacterium]|nr:endonuclease/exonuclease/phosphatase family protein [Myxococcales bacterium]
MSRIRRFAPKALQATFILSALFAITVRSAPSRAITTWRMNPSRAMLLPGALPDGIAVRAGSWNVYGGNFSDATTIGAALGALHYDVVGLQEVPHAVFAEDVAHAMGPEYTAYFGDGKALISRTPLVDAQTVSLVNGRGFVRATTVIAGVPFSIYAAHLGWNLEGNRQNREFMDEWVLPDPNPYLMVMGDFNDEHLSAQIDILEEDLDDVWTKLGLYPGERISWPSNRFDGDEGSQLIDNVFVRRAAGAIVLQGDVVNLSPVLSDHKPIWADLLFSPDPGAPFTEDPFAEARRPDAEFPENPPENLLVNPG